MTEFQALLLSVAIEAPVAWGCVRFTRWPSRGAPHVALAAAVATAVTHPQLWAAALWLYPVAPYWLVLLGLEALVVVGEGMLIAWMAGMRFNQAMLTSLAANSASLLAGLVLTG